MGTVMDAKTKGYCDEVFTQLSGMQKKILEMKDNLARTYGTEKSGLFETFERHLSEIADHIEWKLQILSHACPYDWKGSVDAENIVSVGPAEKFPEIDFSGGYVGG